jgi:hypothetical protein
MDHKISLFPNNDETSLPIATLYGGYYNGKVVYLNNLDDDSDDFEFNEDDFASIHDLLTFDKKTRTVISDTERGIIEDSLLSNIAPKSAKLKRIYLEALDILNKNNHLTDFKINDGILQPIPTLEDDQVDIGMVCGATGSGKSTYISKFAIEYMKLYPKNHIYLFSRKKTDKILDMIPNLERILLDKSFIPVEPEKKEKKEKKGGMLKIANKDNIDTSDINELPVINDLDEEEEKEEDKKIIIEEIKEEEKEEEKIDDSLDIYSNSMCIFDDVDTIEDVEVRNAVIDLRNDLLQNGRCRRITTICSSHVLLGGKKTKDLIQESSFMTFFPGGGNSYQVKQYLKRYQNLSNSDIEKIISLPTRWITLYTRYPKYLIYESGAYFIK